MQGLPNFIPTEEKARYINLLLKVGFHSIDFGSFVSPRAIPQMRDTAEVLERLELTETKLLAIIANQRGANDAVQHEAISYLGYPLSVSETFQQRNTNRSIEQALADVQEIQNLCVKHNKTLVTYLSMGFGNPYGDAWSPELVLDFAGQLQEMQVQVVSLADTVGNAKPEDIQMLFERLIPEMPEVTFGAHFHSTPANWREKVEAAYESGCRRFDGALRGYGGCPMAKDDLTGNVATELMGRYFQEQGEELSLNEEKLQEALRVSGEVMG